MCFATMLFLQSNVFSENVNFKIKLTELEGNEKVDNVEFKKEGRGKIFVDGNLIFNGMTNKQLDPLRQVSFKKIGSGIYFFVCSEVCDEFIYFNKKIHKIDTNVKWYGANYIKEVGGNIFFATMLDDVFSVFVFDKEKEKQVGGRSFILKDEFNDFEVIDNNLIIKNDNKIVKKVSLDSFSERSLYNDNKIRTDKLLKEEKKLEEEKEKEKDVKSDEVIEKSEKISNNNLIVVSTLAILILFVISLFVIKRNKI